MAHYRQLHCTIWKDGWFLDLPRDLKLLFIYLFGNDLANVAGLYKLPVAVIGFEMGMDRGEVEQGLEALEQSGKVLRSGEWVWVRNLLKYNLSNPGSPKMRQHLRKTLADIPEMPLKDQWLACYGSLIQQGSGGPGGSGGGRGPGDGHGDSPPPERGAPSEPPPSGQPSAPAPEDLPATGPGDGTAAGRDAEPEAQTAPRDTVCITNPTRTGQEKEPDKETDPGKQTPNDPKGGTTESAGADAGRPPTGAVGARESATPVGRVSTPGSAPVGRVSIPGSARESTTPVGRVSIPGSAPVDRVSTPGSARESATPVGRVSIPGSAPVGRVSIPGSTRESATPVGRVSIPGTASPEATPPAGRVSTPGSARESATPVGRVSIPGTARESTTPVGRVSIPGSAPVGRVSTPGSARESAAPVGRVSIPGTASPEATPPVGRVSTPGSALSRGGYAWAGVSNPGPSSFGAWASLLMESSNRPATLQNMFGALFPGRDPPAYGYLGRVGRAVGGAGRLAELLWQHSTRPPTGDVLAYILAAVHRERQRLAARTTGAASAAEEPAGFDGIREWMDGEGMPWQAQRPSASAS